MKDSGIRLPKKYFEAFSMPNKAIIMAKDNKKKFFISAY